MIKTTFCRPLRFACYGAILSFIFTSIPIGLILAERMFGYKEGWLEGIAFITIVGGPIIFIQEHLWKAMPINVEEITFASVCMVGMFINFLFGALIGWGAGLFVNLVKKLSERGRR